MHNFEKEGYCWEALDCTYNNRYPVTGLLVLDKKRSKYFIVLGADPDFEIAFERCVTELLQGRKIEDLALYMRPIDFEKIGNNKIEWSLESSSDYYDYIDNYIMNGGSSPTYLFMETKQVEVPKIFKPFNNNRNAFQYMLQVIENNQLKIYLSNYSYLGFPTYRVYVPKLSKVFEIDNKSFEFYIIYIININQSRKR